MTIEARVGKFWGRRGEGDRILRPSGGEGGFFVLRRRGEGGRKTPSSGEGGSTEWLGGGQTGQHVLKMKRSDEAPRGQEWAAVIGFRI